MGTERCALCSRQLDEADLTEVGGRLLCPRCEAAARGGRADAAAPAPAPSAAAAGPTATATPGGAPRSPAPVIALRAADGAPRAGPVPALLRSMREWAAGRWWWWRLPILFFFAWLLWRHGRQLTYQSPLFPVDYVIHEAGHVVFRAFGEFMGTLGGSLLQCLVPPLCILLFVKQRDWFAMLACFGWLSVNLFEVALYVNDARPQGMDLASPFAASGEDIIHDWNWLLTRTGLLLYDQAISRVLRGAAWAAMLAFLVPGSWLVWVMLRSGRRAKGT